MGENYTPPGAENWQALPGPKNNYKENRNKEDSKASTGEEGYKGIDRKELAREGAKLDVQREVGEIERIFDKRNLSSRGMREVKTHLDTIDVLSRLSTNSEEIDRVRDEEFAILSELASAFVNGAEKDGVFVKSFLDEFHAEGKKFAEENPKEFDKLAQAVRRMKEVLARP